MDWMDSNQLGRRNLHPNNFTLILGRRYNRAKKASGGRADRDFSGDQFDPPKTADKLATEYNVSPATVKRAGQYSEALAGGVKELAAVVTTGAVSVAAAQGELVRINFLVPAETRVAWKKLAIDRGVTMQQLIIESMNQNFKK